MAQVIIKNLHSLTAEVKLGNVFKAMNLFMESYDEEITTNITNIMTSYQPSNNLEKLIRIRLIDRYKCYDEVLNILKSDDAFFISHALQCSWFFQNSDLDSQYIVDCLLPHMSYVTRLKVLKRYSKLLKSPKTAVTFFNCLKERYGLNTALTLLPACDAIFVKSTLETISVTVSITILTSLFSVYPLVVISYINNLLESVSANKRFSRTFRVYSFQKIFILLASKEPHKFALLMEKYHKSIPFLKLGKRSTKHFVNVAFDLIKKNPVIYGRIFNWKLVVSCLSLQQISELQLAMFPKTVQEFFQIHSEYCSFVNLTSFLKEPINREILVSNFHKAYKKPLTDYLDVIGLSLAAKLPKEIKENWVESKLTELNNLNDKAKYIVHLPSKKSLPMLKKMMEVEGDVILRSEIVNCMFQTMKMNNDEILIGDICNYVVKRFRNDQSILKENLLSKLSEYKGLIGISDECWKSIEETIDIIMFKNTIGLWDHDIVHILSTLIYSRLIRNLPISTQFDKLLKLSNHPSIYNLCKNTPYEKQCLELFLDYYLQRNLSKMNKQDESDIFPEKLLTRLCQWNAHHKNDRIALPDWLNELLDRLFSREEYDYKKISFLEALKKDQVIKHDIYSRIFPTYIDPSILTYKLHYYPELVVNFIGNILKKILDKPVAIFQPYQPFFKQAKLYPALNLPNIISEHCISVLQEKCDNDENSLLCAKKNAIRVLSFMLPTEEFVKIISGYYPKGSAIDDYSDEGRELFQLQTEIAVSLKYVNHPSKIFESLKKFAVGDYLSLVVGSLNSICLQTPEHIILPLIKQWLDCPISLRKHFFRAYFKIAPISSAYEILVGLFESEKNPSMRMLLFKQAERYFLKEPNSETFNILKGVIDKFHSSDEAIITELFVIKNVPDEFISEYLQILWNKTIFKNKVGLMRTRSVIIDFVDPGVLKLLSEDFCDALLTEVFLQNEMNVKIFAVNYLLYSQDLHQLNTRFEKVMFEIEKLLKKWDDFEFKAALLDNNVFQSRRTISFFVNSLVRKSFNKNEEPFSPCDVLKKLKDNLLCYLQENDILIEIILLQLAMDYHITANNSELMCNFSKFIEPVVYRMIESYGDAVIGFIYSEIEKILAWNFSEKDLKTNQLLLSEFLLNSTSKHCFILGIKLIPSLITSDIPKYKELLTTILQNTDPLVKPYASKLFKELRSSDKVE